LGNIGGEDPACNTGKYISGSTTTLGTDYVGEVYLKCTYGVLDSLKIFGQMSANDNVNCNAVIVAPTISE